MIIPIHCWRDKCSPNKRIAPNSVHTGLVARIGPTIVIGRCFNAKNEHIHDAITKQVFKKMRTWVWNPEKGICNNDCEEIPISKYENPIIGANNINCTSDEKNKTGNTAFLVTDTFLKTS